MVANPYSIILGTSTKVAAHVKVTSGRQNTRPIVAWRVAKKHPQTCIA